MQGLFHWSILHSYRKQSFNSSYRRCIMTYLSMWSCFFGLSTGYQLFLLPHCVTHNKGIWIRLHIGYGIEQKAECKDCTVVVHFVTTLSQHMTDRTWNSFWPCTEKLRQAEGMSLNHSTVRVNGKALGCFCVFCVQWLNKIKESCGWMRALKQEQFFFQFFECITALLAKTGVGHFQSILFYFIVWSVWQNFTVKLLASLNILRINWHIFMTIG